MLKSPLAHTLLKGHSGAVLTIGSAGGQSFVRKQVAHAGLNQRLQAQALKQQLAWDTQLPCPRILGTGEEEGCFYFDMEYLPSISVAQMLMDSVPFDRQAFLDFVERTLHFHAAERQPYIPAAHFTDKVQQVYSRCKPNVQLADLLPAIERVADTLLSYDWATIPQSGCHGDFTLENILYNKDRGFFLIDFDQVELSSYYLDAAKLFQDLWGHWCLRDLAVSGAGQLNLLNAMLHVDALRGMTLKRLLARSPEMQPHLLPMVLLHLFRVLPYCREQGIAVFVLMRINQMLSEAGMH
ncbi:MAG: aminoglycoside phosphotransferase family protein [Pseudomonadota bacterium]